MKVKIIKNVLNTTAFVTVDYLNQSNFSLELLFRCVGTRDRELLRELTLRTQLCQLGESYFPERDSSALFLTPCQGGSQLPN